MFPDISCDDIFRLETARLWLRWVRAGDAGAVAAFASRAEVAQMTASIPHPYPPQEAQRFILGARASTASGQALILAVTQKNKAQTVIGIVSAQAEGREVEIGYVIAPEHAGHGYATEATTALVDAVFNLTEVHEIKANSRVINPASRRVLEKCGFSLVDTGLKMLPARGGKHPCDFFRLTRHQRMLRERDRLRPMAQQRRAGLREGPHTIDQQSQQ